jgi:hypothetical protein
MFEKMKQNVFGVRKVWWRRTNGLPLVELLAVVKDQH